MLSPELVRKIRQIEISTRHLVMDRFAGEYHSVFKGQGMEFDEVRPYYPGDEVRRIDWNITARAGTPFIRRYKEERELTVMLVVDASASGDFGTMGRFKRELAVEMTAVLSFAATSNNDRVGLLIFTDRVELLIPPRKGRKHVLRLIRDLLIFKPSGKRTDIKLALETINLVLKRRGIIFLISDFLTSSDDYRRLLAITNQRHDVVAVDLYDSLEKGIADVGVLVLEDAETGAMTLVDTGNEAWREYFAGQVGRHDASKDQIFATLGIDSIKIETGTDYVAKLTRFFRLRARRLGR